MERRIHWGGTPIVAVVLLAWGATLLGPASPASAGVNPKPSVRAPRDGQHLPARPAWVKLYLGSAKLVEARLNGRRIGDELKGRRHGRAAPCVGEPVALTRGVTCRLRASPSHGLRYGKNMLKARFKRHHKLRVRRVPFRVARHRPLAAAGRDTFGDPRQRIHLNGRPSLIPPTLRHRLARSGKKAKLRYRWRLVDRPHGSHGKLTGAHTSRATLKLGRRGRYKLRLTVTAPNGRTGRDSVVVRSETQGGPGLVEPDPTPAVPVDTMTTENGQPGIQVGGNFYPAQNGSWAQLVTLDRQTLKPVTDQGLGNKSYTNCTSADTTPCVNELKADLGTLGSNDLVIVSSPPEQYQGTYQGIDPVGLEGALTRIGVSPTVFSDESDPQPGSISAVGTSDVQPGQGDWKADVQEGGEMRGDLVRDNEKNYVFASSDRLAFNTHAPGSTDTGQHECPSHRVGVGCVNEIQVGARTYDSDQFQSGGFQVVVVDAQNPDRFAPVNETFNTGLNGDRSQGIDQLDQMSRILHDANSSPRPELVFIVSLGDPSINYPFDSGPDAGINVAAQRLVDEVEQAGGTRNAFYPTLTSNNPDTSYTLVSLANSGAGQGQEGAARGPYFTNVPLNTMPISGTLAPTGPNSAFEVLGAPRIGPEDSSGRDPSLGVQELSRIAFRRPTPWPEEDPSVFPNAADRAHKQAAISWIGTRTFNTDNLRGMYWTRGITDSGIDKTYWTSAATKIQNLKYPPDVKPDSCPASPPQPLNFCPSDLEWAQTELTGPDPGQAGGEIGWLINEHTYLESLAAPFAAKTQLTSWADVQSIADSIQNDVHAPASVPITKVNVTAIFDFVRGMLEVAPGIGEAAIAVNNIYDLVADITEVDVGHDTVPVGDDFTSTESQMGADLAKRLNAALDTLTQQLPNTIAADYGKLSVVGACTQTLEPDQSKCPFPLSDWDYRPADQTDARSGLINSTRAWAYSKLLPVKYTLFQLPDWWRTSVSDNNDFYAYPGCPQGFGGYLCNPFNAEPATGQFAKPIYRNMPTFSHTLKVVPYQYRYTWSFSGDTWRIYALGRLDKSDPNNWQMQVPDTSVTNQLFKPIDKNHVAEGPLGADPETFFDRYFQPVQIEHYPNPDSDTGWCQLGSQPCGGQQPPSASEFPNG